MHYIIVHAIQDSDFGHETLYGGAKVGCWILRGSAPQATEAAIAYLKILGWSPLGVDHVGEVTAADYAEDEEGQAYYEQALSDEEVFVFYTYPP